MLQVSKIQKDYQEVLAGLQKRNLKDADLLLSKVLELDQKRKESQTALDAVLQESKLMAKQIGALMKEGNRDEAEAAKAKTADLKAKSKALSAVMTQAESSLQNLLYDIPNVPHPSVPNGFTDEDNEVLEEVGEIPTLADGAKPHWDLIKSYDIIDFELGNKISGAGFPVYKGKGAKMQRALINFFLNEASNAGYEEVMPPIVVNEASGYGTGQLPDKEGQMYYIPEEKLYLIPTAEVPITNLYRGVILKDEQLPIKNVGHTPCFIREAGSWGSHVRGLNRLHQFDKVEIVQVCKPEDSYAALEEMMAHVASLLKKLELPYRRLRLCAGDLGFTSVLTYDFEVYSAAQKRWLEVSSVSNFESFQANRLKLRYKDTDNKSQLLHTLNGSALALPRILASILENNQTPDGIRVPKVLQAYTGFDMIS